MEWLALAIFLIAISSKRASEVPMIERNIVQLESVPGHYLRADAAAAFERAVAASDVPRVTSSFRTREEQERLYALYISGKGNLAAKPGTSKHEFGLAIDARGSELWELAMVSNGFARTVSSEPWHWEFMR